MYRPKTPFTTQLTIFSPTYTTVNGVRKKTFPLTGAPLMASFKTYGGTDKTVNGILAIEDTAEVETWYYPGVLSDSRVRVDATGALYDVIGEPENIEMRNMFMKFKVKRVKGQA